MKNAIFLSSLKSVGGRCPRPETGLLGYENTGFPRFYAAFPVWPAGWMPAIVRVGAAPFPAGQGENRRPYGRDASVRR
ncbi:hypothetical protein D3Z53_16085 [Lachnospiraceae bacterium]|nr:hypothetical protein [Lachnospiraceae bacterium]